MITLSNTDKNSEMRKNIILTVDNVSKHFGKRHAVKNLSFDLEEKTICCLLGPNGAGKTTLFRMICGILTPDTGSISFLQKQTLAHKELIRQNIGYLPENTQIYEDFTVEELLSYFAQLHNVQTDTSYILDDLDLTLRKKDLVGQLSFGLKRRVSLSLALVHKPRLLILDELTNGLDHLTAMEIRKYLRKLVHSGTTILYSTHNLYEAEELSDKMVIIKEGEKLYESVRVSEEAIPIRQIYEKEVGSL